MGLFTFMANAKSTKYAFAVICLIGLGFWLLFDNTFDNHFLYGILLIVLGIVGLFTIKFFFRIHRYHTKYVAQHHTRKENLGAIFGAIFGGAISLIYIFFISEKITYHTGDELIALVIIAICTFIGHLFDKNKEKYIN